jgi:hypothetical protein
MPALFGYLVAVSILLGGAYAGLEWLSTPQGIPAEKTATHARNTPNKPPPTKTGGVAAPNAVNRQASAETTGKAAAVESSDQIDHETKHTGLTASRPSSKAEKTDSTPAGGCAPIGLTANGDLVFSMPCQEMIERHRRELAASEAAATPPDAALNQAAPSAKSSDGKGDGAKDRGKEVAAPPPDHSADRARSDAVATSETKSNNRPKPEAEHQVAPREHRGERAAMVRDNDRSEGPQVSMTTGESRSGGQRPDIATTPGKSAKQKRTPQRREAISRTAERGDAPEQRLPPATPPRRMAARGDSELWYNVLGLR